MTDTPNSPSWPSFIEKQRARILRRLERYNKLSTAKEQLQELGDLTPYQQYKINTVSRYLLEAFKRMNEGTYGYCKNCGEAIPVERMQRVPGALQCVKCTKFDAIAAPCVPLFLEKGLSLFFALCLNL